MVRKTLLATTALVFGAALAFAANTHGTPSSKLHAKYAPEQVRATVLGPKISAGTVVHHNTPHVTPGKIFDDFSRDANAEFVSWYGFTAVNSGYSYYRSSHYHYKFSEIGFNATAFTGTGKAPKKMEIPGFGYASTYKFEGVIMNATSSGLPNSSIATTSSTSWEDTSLCCSSVRTVKFSGAPTLTSGTEYFAAVKCANEPCYGGWNMENIDFTGGTVDYWHVKEHETYRYTSYTRTDTYNYSSPWHESTGIPSAGAAVIK